LDLKPGGIWLLTMHGPDGKDYENKFVFDEIVRPERLSYHHPCDEGGAHEFHTLVTFEEKNQKTEVTMRMTFPAGSDLQQTEIRYGAIEGAKEHMACLEEYLPEVADESEAFVVSRTLDAPRELVFKAWTEVERLGQWWGPKGMKIEVKRFELKQAGIFLYSMQLPDGNLWWGRFVFQEITSPERLVFINSFSNETGNAVRAPFNEKWPLEVLNTVTFTEYDGRTTVRLHGLPIHATGEELALYKSFHSSMQQGFSGTFEQLVNYLASL
jgi:uncharacterized protein YndB with AHSA1/START domain